MRVRFAVLFLALTPLLVGCGDDEPAQRKAFMAFLQQRIIDKPGVHVPHLTDEETKSFGGYTKHYAVITDFNETLSTKVSKPFQQAMQQTGIRSLQDIVDRQAELRTVKGSLGTMVADIGTQLTAAEKARAALSMPADLKPVYDAAFVRDVSGPAHAMQEALPVAESSLGSVLDLADYITQHKDVVKIQGPNMVVSDPAVQRELNAKTTAIASQGAATIAAQRKLQAMISGN